jgi:hypothetical protein
MHDLAMDITDRSDDLSQDGSIDFIEAFGEEELTEEADEIDDDIDIAGTGPMTAAHALEATYGEEPLKTQSSTGRKPRSGSIREYRTRNRARQSTTKQWGNASTPAISAISLKDIMGGEKKATEVGKVRSAHPRHTTHSSADNPLKAEQKIAQIRTRRVDKKERRNDVKNSLAQFLGSKQQSESDSVEEEDESLISEEDAAPKPDDVPACENDDDKSIKRRNRSRRPTGDDGTSGGSQHSRKQGVRRRLKSEPKPEAEADDATAGGSRRSRRLTRRVRGVPADDCTDTAETRGGRSNGDSKPVEGGASRPRRDHSKTRSEKRIPRPRKNNSAEDDDRSVGSRKSVGGRRRRPRVISLV